MNLIKLLFPILLFGVLMLGGNPLLRRYVLLISRWFSIGLLTTYLFRKDLGFADAFHILWVICFLAGSFLASCPVEEKKCG